MRSIDYQLDFDYVLDKFISDIMAPIIQLFYQLPEVVRFAFTSLFSLMIVALSIKAFRRLTSS